MPRNTAKTATSPVSHGLGSGLINCDDASLVLEALRIASASIEAEAIALNRIMPASPMVERLTVFAENMQDLALRLTAV